MFSRKYKSVREWTHEKQNRFTELTCKDPMFPTPGPGKRMDADGIPEVNYAVIGAGITGCSVAHTMLRHEFFQNDTIMVLEASDRTGGAAGISHAQVTPATAIDWGELVRRVGVRSANQAVVFSHRNLARLGELCAGLSAEDRKKVQFRRVKMVTNFANREPKNLYRRWDPAFRRMFTHLGNRFMEKDAGAAGTEYRFRIKSTSGAVEGPGATLNVGEFVKALFNEMLREHDGRISVRTNTAVRKIKYMSDNPDLPWLLHTSCGLVRASSVIYCCNGRVARLNHRLLGKLFLVNHPMSVEGLTPCPPDDSGTYSWRLIQRPTVDYHTGTFKPGQYSVVQDGHSLTYHIGGGPQTVASLFPMSGEDALQLSKNDHRERLHRLFRQPVERLEDWLDLGSSSADEPCDGTYRVSTLGLSSRCVGYTADALPLVGVIPVLNNHTRQNRQWVAAGCNGQGLDKCWLMGEYLVAMIAGEFVDNRLPDCYQMTQARLSAMRPEDCLNRLLQVDTYEDRTPINTYLAPN